MPTARPRYQVTETPEVGHALDAAARRWPDEPRSRLLVRLVRVGGDALEREDSVEARTRREAVERTSGSYADAFGKDFLTTLRDEWPE